MLRALAFIAIALLLAACSGSGTATPAAQIIRVDFTWEQIVMLGLSAGAALGALLLVGPWLMSDDDDDDAIVVRPEPKWYRLAVIEAEPENGRKPEEIRKDIELPLLLDQGMVLLLDGEIVGIIRRVEWFTDGGDTAAFVQIKLENPKEYRDLSQSDGWEVKRE